MQRCRNQPGRPVLGGGVHRFDRPPARGTVAPDQTTCGTLNAACRLNEPLKINENVMTIFVSGATGRVGGTLARTLIEQGEKVRTLSLPNDPNLASTQDAGIECVTGDLANYEDVRQAIGDATVVFHLAAVISFQPQARSLMWDVNVLGTHNVLLASAALAAERPIRLIFSSSDQVYPTRFARYRPTDELHPREPYTFYGLSKLLGEEMVKFYGRSEKNLATSIAVFSHVEAAHELIDPNGEYSSAAFYVNGRV